MAWYYAVAERDHELQNPTSAEKVASRIELGLPRDAPVVVPRTSCPSAERWAARLEPRKPVTPPEPSSPPNEPELPERWSVQRKSELILRLLRGEALDAVSRESQVPAHELESWKRIFLEQGTRGLKTRSDPEERELTLARAKIGELMMRLELAEHLIEKRGLTDEWKKQRR